MYTWSKRQDYVRNGASTQPSASSVTTSICTSDSVWFGMQPLLLCCLWASLLLASPWAVVASTQPDDVASGANQGIETLAHGRFRPRALLQTGANCPAVPGYTLFAGQNHVGPQSDQVSQMSSRTASTLAAACNANSVCKGFNTYGVLWSNVALNTVDPSACFYVRDPNCLPVTGFLLVKGKDHTGDVLGTMQGQTPQMLSSACSANSLCKGFNFAGTLFTNAAANVVDKSACLYMREPDCPNVTGYTLSRDSNHVGDVVQTLTGQTAQQLATACSAKSNCAGFNSDGVLVSNATINDVQTSTCFYARINNAAQGGASTCTPVAGYTVTAGQNHMGDAVAALPGTMVETLAAVCNMNSLCAGFSSPYGTLVSVATLNTVDPLACFYTKSTPAATSPSPSTPFTPSPSPSPLLSPSPSSTVPTCAAVAGFTMTAGWNHLGDAVQVLPGQTSDQLAAACTASTTCVGFNTFGTLVSNATLNSQDSTACFYTRVTPPGGSSSGTCAQVAGYNVTAGQNHVGDVIQLLPGQTTDQLSAACTANSTCAGFSFPSGNLVSSATLNTVDATACFYTKAVSTSTGCTAVPGFIVTQGKNHLGDALQILPGSTAQQLAAACAANSLCVGFNTPYGTLVSVSSLNSVDPLACFYTLDTGGPCPSLPGYTITKGQTHIGDALQVLPGQTAMQLSSACDANSNCAGFGLPSGNLVSNPVLNSVDSSACFYARDIFTLCPVLPGYTRTLGQYHSGDVLQVLPATNMSSLAAACTASTSCAGFTSAGSLVSVTTLNANDTLTCFYAKSTTSAPGTCTPTAGYTLTSGMNHLGDVLSINAGQTPDQLAASCNTLPTCMGFNSYGALLTNTIANTADSLACLYTRTGGTPTPSPTPSPTGSPTACPTVAGYTAYQSQDHANDTITTIPVIGQDPTTLATSLKQACDSDRNCRGFNTLGELKARSSLYAAPNVACFYRRNELVCPPVAGYTVKYGQNHAGDTLVSWGANRTIGLMAAYCDADPRCMAFNNWGYTKSDASINGPDKDICLYTRNCPIVDGYSLLKGQNHAGDDLKQLPGWTMHQLAMACDNDPKCLAFNSYGHTKSALYINSLDPQICFYYRTTPRKPKHGDDYQYKSGCDKKKPCTSPSYKGKEPGKLPYSSEEKPCDKGCPSAANTPCSQCHQSYYYGGMDQWDSSNSYGSYQYSTNVPASQGCTTCGSNKYPTNPYNSYGW